MVSGLVRYKQRFGVEQWKKVPSRTCSFEVANMYTIELGTIYDYEK